MQKILNVRILENARDEACARNIVLADRLEVLKARVLGATELANRFLLRAKKSSEPPRVSKAVKMN